MVGIIGNITIFRNMYDLTPILTTAAEQNARFKVSSFANVEGQTYIFYSCNYHTYWLKPCFQFEIIAENGLPLVLKVVEVENNNFVKAQIIGGDGDQIPEDLQEFEIPSGTFIHGTLPMADVEISKIGNGDPAKQDFKPMPVIYHQEIYRKVKQINESANDYIAQNLRIYFLDDYLQNNSMLTQDHFNNIIYEMENYANFFVDNLKKDLRINKDYIDDNTHDIIFRVKAGEYVSGKNVKQTFARNLSGVELVISLAVKKDDRCGGC